MIHIQEAIIVEGIYDKRKLQTICDALIVPTYGFSVFTDKERLSYIRRLAGKCGIILLLDSDHAGFKIRSFLRENIQEGRVLDAYIPAMRGKEKRKTRPSSEGTLGVEGLTAEILAEILSAVSTKSEETARPITRMDFYTDGLSGGEKSAHLRAALCAYLALPPTLSAKALLAAVNTLMTYDEYKTWCENQA